MKTIHLNISCSDRVGEVFSSINDILVLYIREPAFQLVQIPNHEQFFLECPAGHRFSEASLPGTSFFLTGALHGCKNKQMF